MLKVWMRTDDPSYAFRVAKYLSAKYGRRGFAVFEDRDPQTGGDAYPCAVVSAPVGAELGTINARTGETVRNA